MIFKPGDLCISKTYGEIVPGAGDGLVEFLFYIDKPENSTWARVQVLNGGAWHGQTRWTYVTKLTLYSPGVANNA